MVSKNMNQLLEQLKAEPEWIIDREGEGEPDDDYAIIANGRAFVLLDAIESGLLVQRIASQHNATVARLLACVEALEMALETNASCDGNFKRSITAKLAAALEDMK